MYFYFLLGRYSFFSVGFMFLFFPRVPNLAGSISKFSLFFLTLFYKKPPVEYVIISLFASPDSEQTIYGSGTSGSCGVEEVKVGWLPSDRGVEEREEERLKI